MAQAGERIGAYEVVRLIARGGMATVYQARQPALDRAVALKRLDLRTEDSTLADRFIRESRIAASFDHPNIVTVYDFFECEGVPYIAMEYLPRGSLRPCVTRLSPPEVFGVIEGALAGLAHAEQRGIVHRDLKPENVLVTTSGAVKIADFGIAKAYTKATSAFTAPGAAVGTPAYMAPEQALSKTVGPFTDLYALGVMAYEMLAGRPPFDGAGSPMAVMYRHVSEAPPPLTGADPRLAAWVFRMLEKRPEARPAGAAQAWAELEELVVDILGPYWRRHAPLKDDGDTFDAATTTAEPRVPTTRRRPAPTPVQPRPRRRWRLPLAGAGVALAVGGAAAIVGFDGEDPAKPAVVPTPAPRTAAAAPFDFDGDGDASTAVGITDAGRRGAGIVVIPRLERRLAPPRPRPGLDFGAALASADLNRDRYADLVVGAPGANTTGPRAEREGALYVFSGTRDGPRLADPLVRRWRPDGDAYRSARFGAALATGDLDGDGFADLAVGTPGSDGAPPDEDGLGSIVLIFGDENGLSDTRVRTVPRPAGSSGRFGSVLAIADVTRDGRLDLLEGAPGPEGHATFCKGTDAGPETCRVMDGAVPGPAAIAAGDVTGDGWIDVVHGIPDADGLLTTDSGAVRVWRGGRGGPTGEWIDITQESPDIQGNDESGDRFGASVAVGSIDRDKFADIVVGTPGNNDETGRVAVLFGDDDGVDETRDTGLSEATAGLLRLEPGSRAGASVGLLDLNGDGRRDLAITAPGGAEVASRMAQVPIRRGAFVWRSLSTDPLPRGEARIGAP